MNSTPYWNQGDAYIDGVGSGQSNSSIKWPGSTADEDLTSQKLKDKEILFLSDKVKTQSSLPPVLMELSPIPITSEMPKILNSEHFFIEMFGREGYLRNIKNHLFCVHLSYLNHSYYESEKINEETGGWEDELKECDIWIADFVISKRMVGIFIDDKYHPFLHTFVSTKNYSEINVKLLQLYQASKIEPY